MFRFYRNLPGCWLKKWVGKPLASALFVFMLQQEGWEALQLMGWEALGLMLACCNRRVGKPCS